jgi:glucose-6-phosphate isomerase
MSGSNMEVFDTGLDIIPESQPMGFRYGTDCFGPDVESRKLDDIRGSLMDPECAGPEVVYAIAMDVGKMKHRALLKDQHLLFGVVTYAKGKLGNEPVRSQGHIHKNSRYGGGWSTPEVYQIWSGKAIIYMQEFADDMPGRCYAVYANPGDVVIVPPAWAHATISADPETPLTFGAWCDLNYGFEYDKVRAHRGLAWYPTIADGGMLQWHHNKHYRKVNLIEKVPEPYAEFNIRQGVSIYRQYEEDPDMFLFVPKPVLKEQTWVDFIP